MKALVIIIVLSVAGYYGYQKHLAGKAGAQVAEGGASQASGSFQEGQRLETSHPSFYGTMEQGQAVLRMKPEVLARLNAMAPGRVVMFATSWCPYCAKAREVFAQNKVRFTELDLEADSRAKDFLENTMGMSGFPILVIGNRVTAGYDEGQILASLKEL
jgi:mycoredoxin